VLDLVIADALLVDGTGSAPRRASVGVAGDRVAVIWPSVFPAAHRTVAAGGRALCPGFVDVHNHSDLSPLVMPEMPSTVRMGVTTVVVGNCGSSPWPLAGWSEAVSLAYGKPDETERPSWRSYGEYLDALGATKPAVNVATLVGHGSIRLEVMGEQRRPPDDAELATMGTFAGQAVADGAFGMSTGLIYVPGIHSRSDEIVALARAAGRAGGLYASHIRGEGRDLFAALDEAIAIGRRAELPVHVSHLKCESARVWGRAGDVLERLRAGAATGDQYPYAAWNSSLASLLPPWAPVHEIATLVGDDDTRRRLRAAVEEGEVAFQSSIDGVGWERIVVVDTADATWRGLDVATIAGAMSVEPFDAFVALLMADAQTSCIGHAMQNDDVATFLADPEVFVASDASATAPDGPGGDLPVHPREYGTFPRALAMARDEVSLPLEAVVRKMTSLPADRFGLVGRGRIEVGAFADLVMFEPSAVADVATYEMPHRFPVGIDLVVVNGAVAWEPGASAIARRGRALRRGGSG